MENKQQLNTLQDVKKSIPSIEIDLRYATSNNFVHQQVYDFKICYLLVEVIEKLKLVQQDLASLGLGLKIWDGYRPMYAQEKFWKLMPDENYVAHPKKGSRHTRGTAVDVTLINVVTKEELAMPSGFDDFSERAHANYTKASMQALANRDLLINAMEKHGFTVWHHEWWHFDLINWQNYPVLDFIPR